MDDGREDGHEEVQIFLHGSFKYRSVPATSFLPRKPEVWIVDQCTKREVHKTPRQETRSTTMTLANDEQNHINSPNWCLARASSPASAVGGVGWVGATRAQLHAQTEAFQALSHSITLLEQESNYQQGRINALEEEVKFAAHLSRGEMFDELIQKKIQELWKTMTKEVEGLQSSMVQKQSSMENLSQDVLESKKFLWEELESVQGELRHIHQKLKDQEVDITRNLVSIKKMQENQMKCTKFLTQLRGKTPDDDLAEKYHKPGTEELNEICGPGYKAPSLILWDVGIGISGA
ncbi:hypothetical protein Chor_007283 [Crotalus horridus]